jgi:AcrR family transcriptional regulator
MAVTERRAARKREIIEATRALFDERGVRDAQIEDIARAVGINRAIIYRHFSGKEELFALTLVGYLRELSEALASVDDESASPEDRLRAVSWAFLDFGAGLPAFVDCAQALLRRRGEELIEEVSAEVMVELGNAMTSCLSHAVRIIEAGTAAGTFNVADPNLLANVYYTQALGVLNLATLQLSVREQNPGLPTVDAVPFEQVKQLVATAAIAMARGAA